MLPDGVTENLGVAYKNQPNITECQAFSLAVVNTLVKHFQYESSGIHTLIYSHTNILEFIDCFFFFKLQPTEYSSM